MSANSNRRRTAAVPRSTPERAAPPSRLLVWFAALLAVFLSVRALSTLAAGASFAAPGEGWRSVWQLAIVGVLAFGLWRRATLRGCVVVICAVYLGAALVELATPDALFGAIPVDMRDRVVHPLIAALGAAALVFAGRRALAPGNARA